MAKPFRVRLIDGLANGAGAFFHLWLPFKLPVAKLPRGGFMGKDWDAALPDPRTWAECLRVLKPGGHLVAFGAPRLYHRLACQIEDAGFEMRDCLLWLFGSGFPKSLDVSKAIDAAAGAEREVVLRPGVKSGSSPDGGTYAAGLNAGFQQRELLAPATPEAQQWSGWGTALKPAYEPIALARKPLSGTVATNVLAHGTGALNIDGCRIPSEEVTGWGGGGSGLHEGGLSREGGDARPVQGRWPANLILDEDAGAMLDAQSGVRRTALKPAYEPIALARKPLAGTVAANVLAHGTGALNIDGCRIETEDNLNGGAYSKERRPSDSEWAASGSIHKSTGAEYAQPTGRWPANLILDEDAGALLDAQSGVRTSGSRAEGVRKGLGYHGAEGDGGPSIEASSGGASRFFYCPKASRSEREAGLSHLPPRVVDPSRAEDTPGRESPRTGAGRKGDGRRNHHATVKPIELMRWLVRLVTPPGGIVLEPFAGSGSTLVACALEDRDAIGMELDPEYVTIGRARVEHARGTS